jgi:hypothetical protein
MVVIWSERHGMGRGGQPPRATIRPVLRLLRPATRRARSFERPGLETPECGGDDPDAAAMPVHRGFSFCRQGQVSKQEVTGSIPVGSTEEVPAKEALSSQDGHERGSRNQIGPRDSASFDLKRRRLAPADSAGGVHAARSAADGRVVADAIFCKAEQSTIAFAGRALVRDREAGRSSTRAGRGQATQS